MSLVSHWIDEVQLVQGFEKTGYDTVEGREKVVKYTHCRWWCKLKVNNFDFLDKNKVPSL